MNEMRSLRTTFKEFDKELQMSRRESEKAWAMTFGTLYTCTFTIASIKLTDGALKLLMNKLSQIGTCLAFRAELLALKNEKKSVDKRTMKTILDSLEEGAKDLGGADNEN